MALDYIAKLTKIQDILKAANTTGSSPDLSASLSSRIPDDSISIEDPEMVSIQNQDFPALFIKIDTKDESIESVGSTGGSNNLKSANINYEIWGICKKEGIIETNQTLSKDAYQMAQNLESVLRENLTLSATASWTGINKTNFSGPFQNSGVWLKGFIVEFQAKHFFR